MCEHESQMFVPLENEPDALAQICLVCRKVLSIARLGDQEMQDVGDSLGDPDEAEDPRFLWG